jgi:hypothetical protein
VYVGAPYAFNKTIITYQKKKKFPWTSVLKVNPGRTGILAFSESFERCLLNAIEILFCRIAFSVTILAILFQKKFLQIWNQDM